MFYRSVCNIPPAGGEKFIVDGIFFKFARDWACIYGGDAYTAKAASLELTNLRQFMSNQCGAVQSRLSLPLTLLADYGGYRIVASALLPISGARTLVYGSSGKDQVVRIAMLSCLTRKYF